MFHSSTRLEDSEDIRDLRSGGVESRAGPGQRMSQSVAGGVQAQYGQFEL